jgi:hypothetical protein
MSASGSSRLVPRSFHRPDCLAAQWSYVRQLKSYAKRAYRLLVGPRLYERLEFRRHVGYWPRLKDPRTFNERICRRKFLDLPIAPLLADKLAVREFVADRIGGEFLTRLYYGGDLPEEADFDRLPPRFVMKGSHGTGPELRALIWKRSALSQDGFVAIGRQLLTRRCGPEVNEWWYSRISPNLLVEEMLLDESERIPADHKIYVFGGVASYVQVMDERHSALRSGFFDREWCLQPFRRAASPALSSFPRPARLAEMLRMAETLAAGLDFVRVDLYSFGGRIVFGEMTLAPGAGWIPFLPRSYDFELGEKWRLCTRK